jgi:hypothetical protein
MKKRWTIVCYFGQSACSRKQKLEPLHFRCIFPTHREAAQNLLICINSHNILIIMTYHFLSSHCRLSSDARRRKNWLTREAAVRSRFDIVSIILERCSSQLSLFAYWSYDEHQRYLTGRVCFEMMVAIMKQLI